MAIFYFAFILITLFDTWCLAEIGNNGATLTAAVGKPQIHRSSSNLSKSKEALPKEKDIDHVVRSHKYDSSNLDEAAIQSNNLNLDELRTVKQFKGIKILKENDYDVNAFPDGDLLIDKCKQYYLETMYELKLSNADFRNFIESLNKGKINRSNSGSESTNQSSANSKGKLTHVKSCPDNLNPLTKNENEFKESKFIAKEKKLALFMEKITEKNIADRFITLIYAVYTALEATMSFKICFHVSKEPMAANCKEAAKYFLDFALAFRKLNDKDIRKNINEKYNLGNAIKQLTIYIDQMNSYDAKITMKCVLKKNVPLEKFKCVFDNIATQPVNAARKFMADYLERLEKGVVVPKDNIAAIEKTKEKEFDDYHLLWKETVLKIYQMIEIEKQNEAKFQHNTLEALQLFHKIKGCVDAALPRDSWDNFYKHLVSRDVVPGAMWNRITDEYPDIIWGILP